MVVSHCRSQIEIIATTWKTQSHGEESISVGGNGVPPLAPTRNHFLLEEGGYEKSSKTFPSPPSCHTTSYHSSVYTGQRETMGTCFSVSRGSGLPSAWH